MPIHSKKKIPWPAWVLAGLLIAFVVELSPRHIIDPDTLGHLATGRWLAENGRLPASDPFTFARPETAPKYGEWLGDRIWYRIWSAGGERAMRVVQWVVTGVGLLLLTLYATRLGASSVCTLLLLLLLLPAAASTFTLRNHIHSYWLIPATFLIMQAGRARPRIWLLLVPLGWLWAHLHGSFVIGWAIIATHLIDAALRREPIAWRWILPVAALQPLLPLLGERGVEAYSQLWDHARFATVYRAHLIEWRSPLRSPAWMAVLPLHIYAISALAALWHLGIKRAPGRLALTLAGVVMAYLSRRFLATGAMLALPAIAAGAASATAAWSSRRRRATALLAALAVAGYVSVAAYAARRRPQPDVFDQPAASAAQFIARSAPRAALVFNSYNAGPWLTWIAAPRTRHYIDPRNTLGGRFVEHYLHVIADPRRFAAEVSRLKITLALVALGDAKLTAVIEYLDGAPDWAPVYLDGTYAVYARAVDQNASLIGQSGYRALRGRVTRIDLAAPAGSAVEADLRVLRRQAPKLAELLAACRAAFLGRDRIESLVQLFSDEAVQRLPLSAPLIACQVPVLRALGREAAARQAVNSGLQLFPADATLRALAGDSPQRSRSPRR